MLEIIDLVTVLDVSSHDQIHINAHTTSQQTRLACETNQDLLVMDSQSMPMRQIMQCYSVMWKCPVEVEQLSEEKSVCLDHSCSLHNLLNHSYYLHEGESPLNSSRETFARDSQFRVFFLVLSSESSSGIQCEQLGACLCVEETMEKSWC